MPDRITRICDGCGAHSYTVWERGTDWALLEFCGHCTREQHDALRMAGFILKEDRREELTRKPQPEPA